MQYSPDRSTYGPFNVQAFATSDGEKLQTFPYASVRGSQIVCMVSDSYGQFKGQGTDSVFAGLQFIGVAEVAIIGLIQGTSSVLKRQSVRANTGPMLFKIPSDEPWAEIGVWARNLSGGRRGTPQGVGAESGYITFPPSNPPTGQPPAPYDGYFINVTLSVQKVRE